jgi:flavin reductase (DIM6/NTAB) family NADH-FMN oxidoreductase RutF
VSLGDLKDGNIFPMNLCGDLGNGYFGFALRTERVASSCVERAGRVALSSLPESQGNMAYRLANNHKQESVDWETVPFATRLSKALQIPVPVFALSVKELEIESSFAAGSHRFFIARLNEEEQVHDGPAFCSIHGFYQYWRLKDREDRARERTRSLVGDAFHKRGRHSVEP